jgi:uncharacterized protein
VAENPSALCLTCGLCCTGALHGAVEVKAEHVAWVRSLGLQVEQNAFRQPCPLYRDDHCSVYGRHPPSCEEYQCALLKKYLAGEIEFEAAIALAREARALIAQGAARPLAPNESDPDVVLRAAALDVWLTKHFRDHR